MGNTLCPIKEFCGSCIIRSHAAAELKVDVTKLVPRFVIKQIEGSCVQVTPLRAPYMPSSLAHRVRPSRPSASLKSVVHVGLCIDDIRGEGELTRGRAEDHVKAT